MTNLGQIKWVNSTLIEFSNWIGDRYSCILMYVTSNETKQNKYSYSFKILNWLNPQP